MTIPPRNAGSLSQPTRLALLGLSDDLADAYGAADTAITTAYQAADTAAATAANSYADGLVRFKVGGGTSLYSSPANGYGLYDTTADDLLFYTGSVWLPPRNLPWGYVATITSSTDNSSTSSSFSDASSLTITWTAIANRRYEYEVMAHCYATTADTSIESRITDSGNTAKTYDWRFNPTGQSIWTSWYWTDAEQTASISGSVTRKVRFRREGGTGTAHFGANGSTILARFSVKDVGPSN